MTGLRDQTIDAMLSALAARSPTPGGGAVAALLAALGAATGHMTLSYSIGRRALADHAALHTNAETQLEALRGRALASADADAAAYARLNALWKLPADDPQRRTAMPEAVRAATEVPLAVLRDGVELLHLLRDLCGATNERLNSDLAIAAICAEAAGRAAAWNVRINLPGFDDRATAQRIESETAALLEQAATLLKAVTDHCSSGTKP